MARKTDAPETAGIDGELLVGPAVVYPVEGTYLAGVPAAPLSTDDESAARLVKTGAFRFEAPEIPEDGPTPVVEVIPAPEDLASILDFYDPPPPAEETQPEGPAETEPAKEEE